MNKPQISDYDSVNYDYENYWRQGRGYEDESDKIALDKMLKASRHRISNHDVYIDIGGSYGREFEIYSKYFDHVIILDYSLNALKKAKNYLKDKKNVYFIAANLYFLPFKDKSIESGQMIRVMHHLRFVDKAFSEIDRIISNFFILEFANKLNAKTIMSNILKGNFKQLTDLQPIQQQFRDTSQGSKGEDQIFFKFKSLSYVF